jgi:hypothetical protein
METDVVFATDSSFMPGSTLLFVAIAAILITAVWAVVATARGGQNGERGADRIPQFYGYTVCLIALLWGLTSVVKVADGALALSAPDIRNGFDFGYEPSVSSFEAFRNTYDRARMAGMPYPQTSPPPAIPEDELHKRYEALRADRIRRGTITAQRQIVTSLLSLFLSAGLFVFHWRWVKRQKAHATL